MAQAISIENLNVVAPRAGIFKRAAAFILATHALRRTAEELSRLGDRELRDIGISRAQIGEIANGAFDRVYAKNIA